MTKSERYEYDKAYRNKPINKAKIKLKVLLWSRKNKDRYKEVNRVRALAWYYKNKDKSRVNVNNRDKRWANAGKLSVGVLQSVYEANIKLYGTLTCIYCNKPIAFGNDTLEHVLPLVRGGKNNRENLAIACRTCNSSKGKKTLEEYNLYLKAIQ